VNSDGTVSGSFTPVSLPSTKETIEKTIADRFIGSMNRRHSQQGESFFLSDPRKNAEDGYDFTVASPKGDAILELMEIAPLEGPYDQAPPRYTVYDFAQCILQGILRKSSHYSSKSDQERFLLLYVTHWTFILSKSVQDCLRYWCAQTPPLFSAVFLFQPLEDQDGEPSWLFPYPPEKLGNFDPEQFRNTTCLNLDLGKLELLDGRDERTTG
jgi:hypothetical protein